MISRAQRRHVEVIIATLMPISPEREKDHPGTAPKIERPEYATLSAGRRIWAGQRVDLFALFEGNMTCSEPMGFIRRRRARLGSPRHSGMKLSGGMKAVRQ